MQKTDKIWRNGSFVPWDDAQVHVLTHALHYGTGVFEGIRAYETPKGAAVFRLTDHLERLRRSAALYEMDLGYSVSELAAVIHETVAINEVPSCYVRPIAFRGYGEMGLDPRKNPVDVVVAVWPWGAYLGEEALEHGVRCKVSSIRRIGPNTLPPAAKASGQYINSVLAKLEASRCGYDEAILLNEHGSIADGSGENVFVVRDGVLHTPADHRFVPAGHHPVESDPDRDRAWLRGTRGAAGAHRPVFRRRGVPVRDGGRGHPGGFGGRSSHRRARPGHQGAPGRVLRHRGGHGRSLRRHARVSSHRAGRRMSR